MIDASIDRSKYLFDVLELERPPRIVDVGASPINPAPYDDLLNNGLVHVIGFEPQPSAFEALQNDQIEGRTVLPYALGNGADGTLNITKNSGFTSLLEPNPKFMKYIGGGWAKKMRTVGTLAVETQRFDDIEEIGRFELLKMDVQGGELDVLRNGEEKISQCLSVFTEVAFVPPYVDQPLIDSQMSFLRQLGFELHKFDFIKNKSLVRRNTARINQSFTQNQPVDGDAIFIKNLLELEQYEDQDLRFLAFLADSIFKSHDLAIHILEILEDRNLVANHQITKYVDQLLNSNPRK